MCDLDKKTFCLTSKDLKKKLLRVRIRFCLSDGKFVLFSRSCRESCLQVELARVVRSGCWESTKNKHFSGQSNEKKQKKKRDVCGLYVEEVRSILSAQGDSLCS